MKANRGDWEGAADAFLLWNKGGGKVLPGLDKRRKDERALFLS
jgi:lysozyme